VKDGVYNLTLTLRFDGIWRALGKKTVSFKLVVNRVPAVQVDAPVKLVTHPGEPLLFGAVLTPKKFPMPYPKVGVSAELVGEDAKKKIPLGRSIVKEADLSRRLELRVVGFPTEGLKLGTNRARLIIRFHYLDQTVTVERPREIICR